jgi:hypothetical protein
MEIWVNLIQTVGISGAMCVGLLWYVHKSLEKEKEENKAFVKALADNTNAIEQLKLLIQELLHKG